MLRRMERKNFRSDRFGELELRELCKLTNLSTIEAWMGALLYPDLFVIEREGDGFYKKLA